MKWSIESTPDGWAGAWDGEPVRFVGPPALAGAAALAALKVMLGEAMPEVERPPAPPSLSSDERKRALDAARAKRARERAKASQVSVTERDARDDRHAESVTPSVTERDDRHAASVTERDADRPALALASASRSGSPSDLQGFSLSSEDREGERARVTASVTERDDRHAASVTASVTVERAADLDAPMPPWALERVDTLRMNLGDVGVEPRSEWAAFLAHAEKLKAEGRPAAITPAAWQSWLTKAWGFARRDRARTTARAVQRDPPGPKAYVADDGSGAFLGLAKRGGT